MCRIKYLIKLGGWIYIVSGDITYLTNFDMGWKVGRNIVNTCSFTMDHMGGWAKWLVYSGKSY